MPRTFRRHEEEIKTAGFPMLDTVSCPDRALYAGQMVSDDLGVSGPLPFAWNSRATWASRFHASR